MERQFGERSFNPSPFQFNCIINGESNMEFDVLFQRRLAGQILTAAYYEPMTISQLSFELGVASVYLEDEVALLERYGFLKKTGKDRYQTNLIILTKDYMDAVIPKMNGLYSERAKTVIDSMRAKLTEIRKIGFVGSDLSDNVLLWDLLGYFCMKTMQISDGGAKFRKLYDDTTGVCYAYGFDWSDFSQYLYSRCAGTAEINGNKSTFILFCACELPPHTFAENPELYPRFKEDELKRLHELLADEFEALRQLMLDIGKLTTETLKEHSPDIAAELIDYHCPHVTLWNIVGWFGAAAINTGALEVPKEDEYAGIIGYL